MENIEPYAFGPEFEDDEEQNASDELGNGSDSDIEDGIEGEIKDSRAGNIDWCKCGNCIAMPTVEESICCTESAKIKEKFGDIQGCVCNSTRFVTEAIDRDVLEVAFVLARRLLRQKPRRQLPPIANR